MKNFDEKIELYLLGDLPESELTAFEKALETDAVLAKSVAEHRILIERLEALRLRNKVKKALAQPGMSATLIRPKATNRVLWAAAASLVLLATALWFFYQKADPEAPVMADHSDQPGVITAPADSTGAEKIVQNDTPVPKPVDSPVPKPEENRRRLLALARENLQAPSPTFIRDAVEINDPSEAKSIMHQAAEAFDKHNYALCAQLLQDEATVTADESAQFLRANARFQLGQYVSAAADFKALEGSFHYKHDARWNFLLCQLALGKMNTVNTLLTDMLADTDFPFYANALTLKAKLKGE